jgi:regulator of protease activity HflC (stomatin/prohibitin superfamily)
MAELKKTKKGVVSVKPYERGVKLRFGRIVGDAMPGFNYALPGEEIITVDMRPLHIEYHVKTTSRDKFPLDFNLHVRYKANDPKKVVEKSPQDLEDKMGALLSSKALKRVYEGKDMEEILEHREAVEKEAKNYLNETIKDWGFEIETVITDKLIVPEELSKLERKLREKVMEKGVAEKERGVKETEAETDARVYKKKAEAELYILEKYYDTITGAVKKITDDYGTEMGRDVVFILFGNNLGYEHPITQKIRRRMEMEGTAEGAKYAAQEIEASPKYAYFLDALKEMKFFGIPNLKNLGELDKKLTKDLFED